MDDHTVKAESPFPAPESAPSRGIQARELGVFLLLLAPALVLGQFVSAIVQPGFVLFAVGTILRDGALVGLILYFLWRNGEPVQRVGWVFRNWAREVFLGILLIIPFGVIQAIISLMLRSTGVTGRAPPSYFTPIGGAEIGLAVFLVAVVAVAEETIFRGYLLLRLHTVTGNMAAAVALSSVIFAIGHGYQGAAGLVAVGIIGVILALLYLWRGSLVVPIVLHFAQDFAGLVLGPLLGGSR